MEKQRREIGLLSPTATPRSASRNQIHHLRRDLSSKIKRRPPRLKAMVLCSIHFHKVAAVCGLRYGFVPAMKRRPSIKQLRPWIEAARHGRRTTVAARNNFLFCPFQPSERFVELADV
jgi:hypothetical protein